MCWKFVESSRKHVPSTWSRGSAKSCRGWIYNVRLISITLFEEKKKSALLNPYLRSPPLPIIVLKALKLYRYSLAYSYSFMILCRLKFLHAFIQFYSVTEYLLFFPFADIFGCINFTCSKFYVHFPRIALFIHVCLYVYPYSYSKRSNPWVNIFKSSKSDKICFPFLSFTCILWRIICVDKHTENIIVLNDLKLCM